MTVSLHHQGKHLNLWQQYLLPHQLPAKRSSHKSRLSWNGRDIELIELVSSWNTCKWSVNSGPAHAGWPKAEGKSLFMLRRQKPPRSRAAQPVFDILLKV